MESFIEKLEALLASKKVKGHKISKSESEQYAEAWGELIATDNCFTDRAERYLYEGLIFAGAKPFVLWALSTDDPYNALKSFFAGQAFGKDTSSTFRVLVSMLAHLIKSCPNEMGLICSVVKRIPAFSKNKEGKTIGDGHRIILKYFINELDSTAQFPSLHELNMKQQYINSFIAVFDELLAKIDPSNLTKRDMATLEAINNWLHLEKEPTSEDENAPGQSPTAEDVDSSSASSPSHAEKEPVHEEKNPSKQFAAALEQFVSIANNACSYTNALEIENMILQETINGLRGETDSLTRQVESGKKKEEELTSQVSELNIQLSKMRLRIVELEKETQTQITIIGEKDEEIRQRTQMIDALSRDRAKQSDEQLHRLASKLRIEYKDFLDAEALPMDCDLGENMREQLKSIFSILIKAGISLE